MNYYEVAILKSPLSFLTYESQEDLNIGDKVLVSLRNRKNLCDAVIIKEVEKPTFKCIEISECLPFYFDKKMIEIATFISQYYVCSLGEALSVFTPFKNKMNQRRECSL